MQRYFVIVRGKSTSSRFSRSRVGRARTAPLRHSSIHRVYGHGGQLEDEDASAHDYPAIDDYLAGMLRPCLKFGFRWVLGTSRLEWSVGLWVSIRTSCYGSNSNPSTRPSSGTIGTCQQLQVPPTSVSPLGLVGTVRLRNSDCDCKWEVRQSP